MVKKNITLLSCNNKQVRAGLARVMCTTQESQQARADDIAAGWHVQKLSKKARGAAAVA